MIISLKTSKKKKLNFRIRRWREECFVQNQRERKKNEENQQNLLQKLLLMLQRRHLAINLQTTQHHLAVEM